MKTDGMGKPICMIIGTVVCFACMDAIAKWLGTRCGLPPLEVVGLRYIGSVAFAFLLVRPPRSNLLPRSNRPRLQLIRSAALVLSTTCAYFAVCHMPLTEMTTLIFAAPLIVPLLAGPFLGETVGPRRIAAIVAGFAGVVIVTRPFSGGHNSGWWVLLPLAGALLNAFYSIVTRKLAASDPPETTMLYTGVAGSVALLPALLFVWTAPPSLAAWLLLALIGAFGALAHWLLILAHRRAPASLLAPFNYVQLVATVIISALVFDEMPDRWTLAGAAVIVGSGLYVFHRERVRTAMRK